VLQVEKLKMTEHLNKLKALNQNMGRTITKDKYHNNRDELEKERRKITEEIQTATLEFSEKAELE